MAVANEGAESEYMKACRRVLCDVADGIGLPREAMDDDARPCSRCGVDTYPGMVHGCHTPSKWERIAHQETRSRDEVSRVHVVERRETWRLLDRDADRLSFTLPASLPPGTVFTIEHGGDCSGMAALRADAIKAERKSADFERIAVDAYRAHDAALALSRDLGARVKALEAEKAARGTVLYHIRVKPGACARSEAGTFYLGHALSGDDMVLEIRDRPRPAPAPARPRHDADGTVNVYRVHGDNLTRVYNGPPTNGIVLDGADAGAFPTAWTGPIISTGRATTFRLPALAPWANGMKPGEVGQWPSPPPPSPLADEFAAEAERARAAQDRIAAQLAEVADFRAGLKRSLGVATAPRRGRVARARAWVDRGPQRDLIGLACVVATMAACVFGLQYSLPALVEVLR